MQKKQPRQSGRPGICLLCKIEPVEFQNWARRLQNGSIVKEVAQKIESNSTSGISNLQSALDEQSWTSTCEVSNLQSTLSHAAFTSRTRLRLAATMP
jgi:hypothetical protein